MRPDASVVVTSGLHVSSHSCLGPEPESVQGQAQAFTKEAAMAPTPMSLWILKTKPLAC